MDVVSSIMIGVFIFMCLYLFWLWFCFGTCVESRQKARSTQQRRPYMGSRSRTSLPQADPTIYVSPANLPPPPKYEAMAPPSYEEVVGIHYPNYQPTQIQPIAQPIATAMAQNASAAGVASETPKTAESDSCTPPTVLTVTNERTATASSS